MSLEDEAEKKIFDKEDLKKYNPWAYKRFVKKNRIRKLNFYLRNCYYKLKNL